MARATPAAPPRGRGHARRLDRDQIVGAALALHREGRGAAPSMRRVARRLEVDVSALYWHFPNKAALVAAVAEAAAGDVHLDAPPDGPWEQRTLALCREIRAALRERPELALHESESTWTTPFHALATGRLAEVLEPSGLPPGEVFYAAQTLVHLTTAIAEGQQLQASSSAAGIQRYVRSLEPALPARVVEAWREIVRLPAEQSFDAYFEFAVAALLAGLSARTPDAARPEGGAGAALP